MPNPKPEPQPSPYPCPAPGLPAAAASPLYLHYISTISPLYLHYISSHQAFQRQLHADVGLSKAAREGLMVYGMSEGGKRRSARNSPT